MGAHIGKAVLVEFAVAPETADPGTLTWLTLGMMRGKSMKTNWDTADTTADSSPDATKTSIATFKMHEFSGDGVAYDEDTHHQEVMESLVAAPGAGTNYRPGAWFRITYPSGKKYTGPFTVTEWTNDSPYEGEATWSIAATSNGAVVFTPA